MNPQDKVLPPRISLGIASGPANQDVCLCVLDHARQSLSTLVIPTNGKPVRQQEVDEGRCDVMDDTSINAMAEFLVNEIPSDADLAVLVEARKLLPHPDYKDTPAGIFAWDAATIGALMAIAKQLRTPLAFGFYEVPDKEVIVLHHIVDAEQLSAMVTNIEQPKILSRGLLRGCAKLLIDDDPLPVQITAIAALLARAPGAYYYWSTFDQPPSLGDVIFHHRRRQSRMQVLGGSGHEQFAMRVRPGPHAEEDISLTYMLAAQAHQDIDSNDANKLALVHVCKEFNYDLRCYSQRADARRVDPRRVWPWPDEDAWAFEEIRRLRC